MHIKKKCDKLNVINWKLHQDYIAFLKLFLSPKIIDDSLSSSCSYLDCNYEDLINLFIADKFIEIASLEEILATVFKSTELQSLAKSKGLKSCNTKVIAAKKLVESDFADMKVLCNDYMVYKCTDKGVAEINKFDEYASHIFSSFKIKSFELLMNGDTLNAYWNYLEGTRYSGVYDEKYSFDIVKKIETIIKCKPNIFEFLNEKDLVVLRSAAAYVYMWDNFDVCFGGLESYEKDYLQLFDEYLIPKISFTSKDIINVIAHFNFLNFFSTGYYIPVNKIIVKSDLGSELLCDACLSLLKNSYIPNQIPEIPPVNCCCKYGCSLYFGCEDRHDVKKLNEKNWNKFGCLKIMLQEDIISDEEYSDILHVLNN